MKNSTKPRPQIEDRPRPRPYLSSLPDGTLTIVYGSCGETVTAVECALHGDKGTIIEAINNTLLWDWEVLEAEEDEQERLDEIERRRSMFRVVK